MKPTPEQLLNIAQTHINSRIPTLQARNSDSLDFYDISVWNLTAALTAAYELGAEDAIRAAEAEAAEEEAGEDI